MKLLFVTLTSILLSFASANAANVVLETGYYNKYLGFGSGGVLHDDHVIQSSITVTFDNGLYLGLWNSYSPDGELNLGDELDYKIGWSGDLMSGWKADLSLTYFDEPNIGDFGSGDIWYLNSKLSHSMGKDFVFNFRTRCYIPVGGSVFEGGWLIGPSVSRNFNLTHNLSLFCDVGVNYDDGGFGMDNGFILTGFTSLDMKMSDHLSWNIVQATLYVPLSVSDSRKTDVVCGSGLKIEF